MPGEPLGEFKLISMALLIEFHQIVDEDTAVRAYLVGWDFSTVKEFAHMAPAHFEVLSGFIRSQLVVAAQEIDSFTASDMISDFTEKRLNLWRQILSGDILEFLDISAAQILT